MIIIIKNQQSLNLFHFYNILENIIIIFIQFYEFRYVYIYSTKQKFEYFVYVFDKNSTDVHSVIAPIVREFFFLNSYIKK